MKKTVQLLRQVYTNALRNFPQHHNDIGAYYERIMARQMNNRKTWICNSEELSGTCINMLVDFENFIDKIRKGVTPLSRVPVSKALVFRGGKG